MSVSCGHLYILPLLIRSLTCCVVVAFVTVVTSLLHFIFQII